MRPTSLVVTLVLATTLAASVCAALDDPTLAAKRASTLKGCGDGVPAYVRSFPNIMNAPMVFQVVVTPAETLVIDTIAPP
jgi:hypothetical protein